MSLLPVLLTLNLVTASSYERVLHTPDEVALAQDAVKNYESAQDLLDKLYKKVEPFLERSPQELWHLLPPPEVPRAFNTSYEGCPCHGRELYEGGFYAWKFDPWNEPWKITCPIGGEKYPSNDFGAYLASGMKDRSLLTGEWADDGWGVQVPGEPKKRWFVAYYCHWFWMNHIIPGILDLSRIYLLNGDEKCALRAAVMLDRIADYYPRLDYNKQCRYAQEFSPSYTGKIVNRIWECGVATKLCEAYDNIRPALENLEYTVTGAVDPIGEPESVAERHRTGEEINKAIQERFVRVVLHDVFNNHEVGVPNIRGNFGMHQETALTAALVLGDERERDYVIDYLMGRNDEQSRSDSIIFCLENMIFRDGIGFETAPSYSHIWTDKILSLSPLLYRLGIDLYQDKRVERLFRFPLSLSIAGGRFSPTIGDSYNAVSGLTLLTSTHAYLGYRVYGEPQFAWQLARDQVTGEKWLSSYEHLFLAPPDPEEIAAKAAEYNPPSTSSNFCDYGVSVLRQGQDEEQVAVVLQYGQAAGHGHDDRLGIEVFGNGAKVIPDFGYPQFASEEEQTFAWDRHTSSHALVVVDESKQRNRNRGQLIRYSSNVEALGFSYTEAAARRAYPGITDYRRGLALIDAPQPVIVDVFWVNGGPDPQRDEHIHDWFIRGFEADFSTDGLSQVKKRKGTLAGEDVPFAYLHDDPELDDPERKAASKRSYSSYIGSSYSYLDDVSVGKGKSGWSADWRRDDGTGVRITMLGAGAENVALCKGRPPRRITNPLKLQFIRLRNYTKGIEGSIFVSLIEPYRGETRVREAKLIESSEQGVVVSWKDSESSVEYEFHIHPDRVFLIRDGKKGAELQSIQGNLTGITPQQAATDILCRLFEDVPDGRKQVIGETLFTDPDGQRRAYPILNGEFAVTSHIALSLGYEPWLGKNAIESVDIDGKSFTTKYEDRLSSGGRYRDVWAQVGPEQMHVKDIERGHVSLQLANGRQLGMMRENQEVAYTDLVLRGKVELSVIVQENE